MPLVPEDRPPSSDDVVGIDVGASRVHGVRLDVVMVLGYYLWR